MAREGIRVSDVIMLIADTIIFKRKRESVLIESADSLNLFNYPIKPPETDCYKACNKILF